MSQFIIPPSCLFCSNLSGGTLTSFLSSYFPVQSASFPSLGPPLPNEVLDPQSTVLNHLLSLCVCPKRSYFCVPFTPIYILMTQMYVSHSNPLLNAGPMCTFVSLTTLLGMSNGQLRHNEVKQSNWFCTHILPLFRNLSCLPAAQ